MKTYQLGVNRILEVFEDGQVYRITLKDTQSAAEAVFHKARWGFFLRFLNEIDEEVQKLKEGKDDRQRFLFHYGGGWQVSVNGGIRCVDLRRFFKNYKNEIKPTRHGIGLRLPEWETLKRVIQQVRVDFPDLDTVTGCFHGDLEDFVNCRECMPFHRPVEE